MAAHLVWQLVTLDVLDRAGCWRLFVSNRWIGLLLLMGIALDRWMAARNMGKERERQQLLAERQEQIWGKTGYELLSELWQT